MWYIKYDIIILVTSMLIFIKIPKLIMRQDTLGEYLIYIF